MDSEVDDVRPVTKKVRVVTASRIRSCKKNPENVPKRIHKAEREKMKREHFNELFIGLANVLELTEQNSGKASILSETTQVVKDMLFQIECLRKENITLLSESQYVETEKKELEDENEVLQHQIHELQRALNKKMEDLSISPSEPDEKECNEQVLQQAPMVAPVYVIPVCSDLTSTSLKPVSSVCKPHPRYPTPADSWPFKILQNDMVSSRDASQNGYNS